MPVDIHPEEKIPGVELIMTRLHAGGKFSGKNYNFSGGLHGVGISVVNALSKQVEVFIKRDGVERRMEFRDGFRASELEIARHGRQEEHRHAAALLARPEVLRHAEVRAARAAPPAAREGGALPRPHRPAVRRGQRRAQRMVLRERPARLPARRDRRARAAAGRNCSAARWRRTTRSSTGPGLDRRRRAGAGELRQPDPDRAGRHPRQRPALRPHRSRCASSATSATCCRAASSSRPRTSGTASASCCR